MKFLSNPNKTLKVKTDDLLIKTAFDPPSPPYNSDAWANGCFLHFAIVDILR